MDNILESTRKSTMELLAKYICESIEAIRSYIQIDQQETLLMAVTDISNFSNPSPEGDVLIFKQGSAPYRPVEYLQSLIAATGCDDCTHVSNEDIERLAHQYLRDYEELFDKSTEYLLRQNQGTYSGKEIDRLTLEAQLLHMVRGNRYRFLQVGYIRPLLSVHREEFLKLFGITSDDIVAGYEKLERALSNGRLEGLATLGKLFEKTCTTGMLDFSDIPNKDSEAAQEAAIEAFSVQHFNVARITGWPKEFIEALSFVPGEARFFDIGEMRYWPVVTLPIVDRPFIALHGETYCFDYYSLTDNFYRAVQKAVLRADPGYSEKWQERQKTASESMVRSILESMLPGCVSYADNCYGSKKHRNENDLLIRYRDALLVVEVKAGRFTDAPPVSDFDSHVNRYRELIEKSNSQCDQMRKYIRESGPSLVLYDEGMHPKATLDTSGISAIFCLSITIENINAYAARAEKLRFLNLKEGVSCIAVDDLMTYRAYFDNPLEFLHFLKQREIASLNKRIALNDEFDHLGMYIVHNCYSLEVDRFPEGEVLVAGYRDELDRYFERVGTPLPQVNKPQQLMPSRFREIIDVLLSSGNPQAVRISSYLLDFSGEARQRLSDGVEMALQRQASTERQIAQSLFGNGNSVRMTYFVFQDELLDAVSDQKMFDYTAAILLANSEEERILAAFRYDENHLLQKTDFRVISIQGIPPSRVHELRGYGEKMGDLRVETYKQQHGKIGRNELCPCGSGKKYKKCHGRNT